MSAPRSIIACVFPGLFVVSKTSMSVRDGSREIFTEDVLYKNSGCLGMMLQGVALNIQEGAAMLDGHPDIFEYTLSPQGKSGYESHVLVKI